MERFVGRLVSSLPGLIARGAGEVHKRPAVAVGLYAAALAGVMASSFGGSRRSLGTPARRRGGRVQPAAGRAPEPARAPLLREIERAGLRVVERVYGPGDEVYTPGDPADSLHFLLSGVVRTYRIYGDFKEATTALLKDGGVFGVLDLSGEGGSHEEFAEALSEARILSVRKAALAWLVGRKPGVALALFSAFSERARQTDEFLVSLLPREVSGRLAALLLVLGERFGEEDEAGAVELGLRFTHHDLSRMIASTREAVSKVMSELRRDGLIEVRDRRIVLFDRSALSERAEGGG